MNRYMVMEAHADRDAILGERVRMQVLNIHASITAAFWHWPEDERRLHLIDLKTRTVYSWHEAQRLMCFEQLKRLDSGRGIGPNIGAYLQTCHLIDPSHVILAAGRELMAEYEPPPALIVPLGYVKSNSRLHK